MMTEAEVVPERAVVAKIDAGVAVRAQAHHLERESHLP
jgi:hypothetical protein